MPITKIEKINSNSFWCMWEITETEEQLLKKVTLSVYGQKELEEITHPVKKRERLASRACIQELVKQSGKEYKGIVKDDHDKPHLIDIDYHISISHSFPYAVGILHKKLPVGIDIEKPVEKLGRIAHRFLNDQEFIDSDGDLKKLCIYWAGKEAIFKLNGKTGLNFKEDIRVWPFELHKRDVIRSEFNVEENKARIALNYWELNGHIVCYCF
ncbi:MAG: 4'-phosphopantetheinyl transferase superfamily protein [Cyclobacteriaceae bacterium]|nr:4'-phosphopantetheinyl transferase superfamily protein [Cyclobacteriaceae bacterium]